MTSPSHPGPDPEGLAYARYWEPVLAGAGHRLLSRIRSVPADYLDIGAGTGSLPLAAGTRWPSARVVGLDASAGMLSVARHRVLSERPRDRTRFEWLAADAARMPLADASFDTVTTAFMLQLVDDRATVLREVRRVLRPGGSFALVTWMAADLELQADIIFDEVVSRLGVDQPASDFRAPRATDYVSVDEPQAELAAAGFDEIEAGPDTLTFSWSRDGYLEFKERYDEYDLFESLSDPDRLRLREELDAAWAGLPDSVFSVSGPLVWATARRPEAG